LETLETLHKRISSTEQLQSLVRNMKSLSAASINQYEHAVTVLEDYQTAIERGLQAVLMDDVPKPRPSHSAPAAIGLVVIGTDRGLCGRFNEYVTDRADQIARRLLSQNRAVHFIAIGSRAEVRLREMGHHVDQTIFVPGSSHGLSTVVQSALIRVDRWQEEHSVGRVEIIANTRGKNQRIQPMVQPLLPVAQDWLEALAERRWPARGLPTFTVSPGMLFSWLIRQHLFISLFRTLAESLAAEHASRLSAMQTAERNIKEHLEDAHAEFRHQRQNQITTELMDLVAGFETLQGSDEDN